MGNAGLSWALLSVAGCAGVEPPARPGSCISGLGSGDGAGAGAGDADEPDESDESNI
jgi:hypothetical protein